MWNRCVGDGTQNKSQAVAILTMGMLNESEMCSVVTRTSPKKTAFTIIAFCCCWCKTYPFLFAQSIILIVYSSTNRFFFKLAGFFCTTIIPGGYDYFNPHYWYIYTTVIRVNNLVARGSGVPDHSVGEGFRRWSDKYWKRFRSAKLSYFGDESFPLFLLLYSICLCSPYHQPPTNRRRRQRWSQFISYNKKGQVLVNFFKKCRDVTFGTRNVSDVMWCVVCAVTYSIFVLSPSSKCSWRCLDLSVKWEAPSLKKKVYL